MMLWGLAMSVEPCGSLPVTHLTVSAHYCRHHQAWSVNASIHTDTGTDDLHVVLSEHRTFGPFDHEDEVLAWLHARVERAATLPSVPWDALPIVPRSY
jgi:hypothetical protein